MPLLSRQYQGSTRFTKIYKIYKMPSYFKVERDITIKSKHINKSIIYQNTEYIMPLDVWLNDNNELDEKSKQMIANIETMYCLRENIHTGELYFIDDELVKGCYSMKNVVTFFMLSFRALISMNIIPPIRQVNFGSKICVKSVNSDIMVINLNLFFLFPPNIMFGCIRDYIQK